MKKMYAIDLDGTLFYPKRRFSLLNKRTVADIKKIENDGDYFVAVTGRNFLSSIPVFKKTNINPYIIGCNGAFLYANGEYLHKKTIGHEIIDEIVEFVKNKYKKITCSVMPKNGYLYFDKETTNFFQRFFFKIYNFFQHKLANVYEISSEKYRKSIENDEVYKLMLVFGETNKAKETAKHANKEVFAKFGDRIETSWSNQAIEITPKDSEKSKSIMLLADHLGVKKEDIYVMGDSGNDIPMFKHFYENSFCMKRASESVKKYAKTIIRNFNELVTRLKEGKTDYERTKK